MGSGPTFHAGKPEKDTLGFFCNGIAVVEKNTGSIVPLHSVVEYELSQNAQEDLLNQQHNGSGPQRSMASSQEGR